MSLLLQRQEGYCRGLHDEHLNFPSERRLRLSFDVPSDEEFDLFVEDVLGHPFLREFNLDLTALDDPSVSWDSFNPFFEKIAKAVESIKKRRKNFCFVVNVDDVLRFWQGREESLLFEVFDMHQHLNYSPEVFEWILKHNKHVRILSIEMEPTMDLKELILSSPMRRLKIYHLFFELSDQPVSTWKLVKSALSVLLQRFSVERIVFFANSWPLSILKQVLRLISQQSLVGNMITVEFPNFNGKFLTSESKELEFSSEMDLHHCERINCTFSLFSKRSYDEVISFIEEMTREFFLYSVHFEVHALMSAEQMKRLLNCGGPSLSKMKIVGSVYETDKIFSKRLCFDGQRKFLEELAWPACIVDLNLRSLRVLSLNIDSLTLDSVCEFLTEDFKVEDLSLNVFHCNFSFWTKFKVPWRRILENPNICFLNFKVLLRSSSKNSMIDDLAIEMLEKKSLQKLGLDLTLGLSETIVLHILRRNDTLESLMLDPFKIILKDCFDPFHKFLDENSSLVAFRTRISLKDLSEDVAMGFLKKLSNHPTLRELYISDVSPDCLPAYHKLLCTLERRYCSDVSYLLCTYVRLLSRNPRFKFLLFRELARLILQFII